MSPWAVRRARGDFSNFVTKPWLILMIKAPEPGKVKTRLAAEIGEKQATEIYRALVERLVLTLFRASDPPRPWQSVVAYSPAAAETQIRDWLAPLVDRTTIYLPQAEGDLGAKLEAVFAEGFARRAPAILALGGDCIDLTADEIESCFDALGSHPLLMGEAEDGGYWTIGMSGPHYEIFRDMPWSSPGLAEATRLRARELNLRISEQPRKSDIDTKADLALHWERLRTVMGEIRPGGR